MIGMVLVSHRGVAHELLTVLNEIVGSQSHATAVAIGPNDDMEKCRDAILNAIKEVNTGKGVIILTDMFGGTPSNLAISSMPRMNAIVLAGMNLPMLIKLASVRETLPLLDAGREAETAGRKYIQLISETLAPLDARTA